MTTSTVTAKKAASAKKTTAKTAAPAKVDNPVRHVRVSDPLWDHSVAKANREGRGIAEVVRGLLIEWSRFDSDDAAS